MLAEQDKVAREMKISPDILARITEVGRRRDLTSRGVSLEQLTVFVRRA